MSLEDTFFLLVDYFYSPAIATHNFITLSLSIGSRVMLIQNVDTKLGLVNGTTGTVVGFVFSTAPGANPILEKLDVKRAALLEPQLPVIFVKVDEEFWNAPQYHFDIFSAIG